MITSLAPGDERRRSPRLRPCIASVFVHGQWREYPLKDVSGHGLALVTCPERFSREEQLRLDLLQNRWPVAEGLHARVVRLDADTAGLSFEELSSEQSAALSRLGQATTLASEENRRHGLPDFSTLVLRYKDRPQELGELVAEWQKKAPELLASVLEALAAGQATLATDDLDRLATMAGCIRATALVAILREIGQRLSSPGAEVKPTHLRLLSRELELVSAGLSRLCQAQRA